MSCGRLGAKLLFRLAKRRPVTRDTSLPMTIQPKSVLGLFSQPWTSATKPAPDHWKAPVPPTGVVALAPATKSPPALVHVFVLYRRWVQVASPVAAGAPVPGDRSQLDVA